VEDIALQQEIAAEIVSSVMDKLGQSGTFFP